MQLLSRDLQCCSCDHLRFHPGKFPLLAACSDDATVSILHTKVGVGNFAAPGHRMVLMCHDMAISLQIDANV